MNQKELMVIQTVCAALAHCEFVSGVSSELIYFNESKGADGNSNSMCGEFREPTTV